MGETRTVVIDFCNSNLMNFGMEFLQELRDKYGERNVSRYGCLTNCGECSIRPFLILNDKIISGKDVNELREKFDAELNQNA
jgi:uncharacterized protein YuzB (UPF0349 family)